MKRYISVSDIERGKASTPGLCTPLSTLGAPAHFTLFIFLTLSASFPYFILFLRAFNPPPIPGGCSSFPLLRFPLGLFLPLRLSLSLFPFKSHPPCNQQQKLT